MSAAREPVSSTDTLDRLAAVLESRKPAHGGDPEKSYVARLLHKGLPRAFGYKISGQGSEFAVVILKPPRGGAAWMRICDRLQSYSRSKSF